MKHKIAIIFWKDAAIHGGEQLSKSEWLKESDLVSGIAVGHILQEDKEKITLAMDLFPKGQSVVHNDQYRVVSTYPKSGIQQIIRKVIERKNEKS